MTSLDIARMSGYVVCFPLSAAYKMFHLVEVPCWRRHLL